MSDTKIDALENTGAWTDIFDERELAALQLADAMCGDSQSIPADLQAVLRARFTEVELAELILVAGQANLNNRAGNAAKQLLGPQPEATSP